MSILSLFLTQHHRCADTFRTEPSLSRRSETRRLPWAGARPRRAHDARHTHFVTASIVSGACPHDHGAIHAPYTPPASGRCRSPCPNPEESRGIPPAEPVTRPVGLPVAGPAGHRRPG